MNQRRKALQHCWPHLIWQPLLAIAFMMLVLITFNFMSTSDLLWAVGAGSLASSSYIVFGKPASAAAMPSRIIGGYFIGMLSGIAVRFLATHWHVGFMGLHWAGCLAALAVGICLFLMVLMDWQHPPAAGMALVLVIDVRNYNVLAVIAIAALLLAFLRFLLRRWLMDLT